MKVLRAKTSLRSLIVYYLRATKSTRFLYMFSEPEVALRSTQIENTLNLLDRWKTWWSCSMMIKYIDRKRLVWIALVVTFLTISANAKNDFVYVRSSSAISGFSVSADGSFQAVPGSPFNALGFDSTASGFYGANRIVVNGDFVYASNGNSANISVFTIDRTTGSLSPVPGSPFPGGGFSSRGSSLGVTSDNKHLYAANLDSGTITVFEISSNGALTNLVQSFTIIGAQPNGIKVAPNGRFLAVTLPFSRAIAMYRINPDGSLSAVPGSPFPTSGGQSGPASVDINCAGDLLFVGEACAASLCATPTTVDVFSIAPNGSLTPIPDSPFRPGVGADANVVALSRDDRKLFVTNQGSHTVTVFEVAADGTLTLVPGSPFHDGGFALQPAGVATNSTETLLFTTNFHGPLSIFRLAPDGVLTTIPGSPFPVVPGQSLSLAVYPAKECVPVAPFDFCIQDDTSGSSLKIKSATGEYQFRSCSGPNLSGTGSITQRGGTLTFQDSRPDRLVLAMIDLNLNRASASLRIIPLGTTFVLSDRGMADNTCACTEHSPTKRVPSNYPTIQQAIDASVNGDTVLVAPGTYFESINFNGKAITVMSEAGPEVTTIDGRNSFGPVVTFKTQESRQSTLRGFTIQNGVGFDDFNAGGGIFITFASPTITGNIVTANRASFGGGIGVVGGSPLIQKNVVRNNTAANGGGISLAGIGAPTFASVLENTISDNTALGAGGLFLSFVSGTTLIRGNIITNNLVTGLSFGDGTPASPGGGMSINSSSGVTLVQNQIVANRGDRGAGMYLSFSNFNAVSNTFAENDSATQNSVFHVDPNVTGTLVNNQIVAKQGQNAFGCRADVATLQLVLHNNNIYAPGGTAFGSCPPPTGSSGNISADPLFVNPSTGDYHLRPGSLSIDRGDNTAPNLPLTDFDGTPRIADGDSDGASVVDIGAFEFPAPFDVCIQDDENGDVFQFNSRTGDYRFFHCRDNFTLTGRGIVRIQACKIEFSARGSDRTISALANTCTKTGNASVRASSVGKTYAVADRDIFNNPCSCR